MTAQIDSQSPTVQSVSDFDEPFGVLLGSWTAAREIAAYRAADVEPADCAESETETDIFGRQVGLRNKLSAYRARRRLNRAFRRNQREFDIAINGLAHDPGAQRELTAIWTLGH